ncbi:LuxR C-terminal-related transcriptional regulator [Spirillospora sp. NPDC029432]|uniref:AAA family ATPase n=1 Tax=Spirillospora sp. NPDC029432 TaxID=3154599 RepID=UPI003452F12A
MGRFDGQTEIVGRDAELESLSSFLDSPRVAFLLEGDAGIGKSTLWRAGVAMARARGHRVLTCSPAEAEAGFAYCALADLLDPVPDSTLAVLPGPQRRVLEFALLRAEADGPVDERAIAVAFLSVLRLLARSDPVMVAVDDAHWLDAPSARVLMWALRRVDEEPVRVLLCARSDVPARLGSDLEQGVGVSRMRRLRLEQIDLASLRRLLMINLGAVPPPRVLARVRHAAAGNLLHALEIARALNARDEPPAPGEPLPVPASLRELVGWRVAELPAATREALLAASALAGPTPELLQGMDRRRRVTRVLAPAEEAGLITLDGDRLLFTHPLIASAVYAEAAPSRRRALHGRLARLVVNTEERARHLALASEGPSESVAAALDGAATAAMVRGAPDAAAELCELAAEATPRDRPDARCRRLAHAAEHHFMVGGRRRARRLLERILPECRPGRERARVLRLLGELRFHDDSFPEAARLLRRARAEAGDDLAALAAIECDLTYVTHTHEGVSVAAAHARAALDAAEELGEPGLLAEALAVATVVGFMRGKGVDDAALRRALALEDVRRRVPAPMRPSVIHACLMFWTGRPEPARATLDKLGAQLAELGDETAQPILAFILAPDACARGAIAEAERHAREGMEAADRVGTDILRAHALTARAVTDAYAGRLDTARQAAEQATSLFLRVGCLRWATVPVWALGFTHLSADDAPAAARLLEPLVGSLAGTGIDEPAAVWFVPDAVEALIATGDLETADATLRWFDRGDTAQVQPWVSATGRRCRGLLLAARGDVDGALRELERALLAHEPLPHPVENARTLLALGRLQRRANRRRTARETLERALAIFEEVGAARWAEQTRAELTRLGLRRPAGSGLTPREEQVARRAAGGATNREIAADLSISAKTVEANLARAYRKLGIHSRAELGALLGARRET